MTINLHRPIVAGSTDVSIVVYIKDSTDGFTPEVAATFESAGIDLSYRRQGAAVVAITEADLATPALDDAHGDGGFLAIGYGAYRLDLPDAAVAAGADHVLVFGTITGMIVEPTLVPLTSAVSTLGTSPVSTGEVITIYQGESREAADGTAIVLNIDGTEHDVSGDTPRLGLTKLTSNSGSSTLEVSGTVVNGGAADQYVYFELTVEQTAALALNTSQSHGYRIGSNYAYSYAIGTYEDAATFPTWAVGYASVQARGITAPA